MQHIKRFWGVRHVRWLIATAPFGFFLADAFSHFFSRFGRAPHPADIARLNGILEGKW